MNDRFFVFANFKTFLDTRAVRRVVEGIKRFEKKEILVLAPSFIHFELVCNELKWKNLAAQTCSDEDFDGEGLQVTAAQIRDFGAEWVLIGHHERRLFEDNQNLAAILNRAQENLLKVVFAFGENEEEKNAGFSEDVFQKQLEILNGWKIDWENLFLAYQPVWAFEKGKGVKIEEALQVRTCVFNLLGKITGAENLKKVKFLVESNDFLQDLKKSGIDGVLVNENGDGVVERVLELL